MSCDSGLRSVFDTLSRSNTKVVAALGGDPQVASRTLTKAFEVARTWAEHKSTERTADLNALKAKQKAGTATVADLQASLQQRIEQAKVDALVDTLALNLHSRLDHQYGITLPTHGDAILPQKPASRFALARIEETLNDIETHGAVSSFVEDCRASVEADLAREQGREPPRDGLPWSFTDDAAFAAWLGNGGSEFVDPRERYSHDPYAVADVYTTAVFCAEPVDVEQLQNAVAYAFHASMGMKGECWKVEPPRVVDGKARLFFFQTDFTKSDRDDPYSHVDSIRALLANGSAIRTTNRAGVGTQGTRLVNPIPTECSIAFGG